MPAGDIVLVRTGLSLCACLTQEWMYAHGLDYEEIWITWMVWASSSASNTLECCSLELASPDFVFPNFIKL